MDIEKYISENQDVLNELESIRRSHKSSKVNKIVILLILISAPFTCIYVVPEIAHFLFFSYLITIPMLWWTLRSNSESADFEVEANRLLTKSVWKKPFKLLKTKVEEQEDTVTAHPFVQESLLLPMIHQYADRLLYTERDFYKGRVNKSLFYNQFVEFGTYEYHQGSLLRKSVWSRNYFFRIENDEWDLKRCFIVPANNKRFHQKELYGFQQEVTSLIPGYRIYTNNDSEVELYQRIYETIKAFSHVKNITDLRVEMHENSIMFVIPKIKKKPLFSPKYSKNSKNGAEIRRIHQKWMDFRNMVNEVEKVVLNKNASNKQTSVEQT